MLVSAKSINLEDNIYVQEDRVDEQQTQTNNDENKTNCLGGQENQSDEHKVDNNHRPVSCNDVCDDFDNNDDDHHDDDTEKQSEIQSAYVSTIQIDKGWAWMVVLSCFLMHVVLMGISKSFGVFIEEFQDKFHVSNKELGVVAGMFIMLIFGSGLGVHVLVVKFSARSVVIAGSLLTSAGIITTAFIQDFKWMYITFGLLTGLGSGLAFNPPCVMIGQSFQKYRAVAYGIGTSGSGVGSFTMPLIVRALIREYHLQGCLVILGAIALNLSVCGVLLPPMRKRIYARRRGYGHEKNVSGGNQELQPSLQRHRKVEAKETGPVLEWSLLLRPTFLLHLVSGCLGFMCNINNVFMLPLYGSQCGLSRDTAALALSVLGISDVVFRLTFPLFTDLVHCRKRLAMACCLVVIGILNMLLPFMTNMPSLMAYAAIFGSVNGSVVSLIPLLSAETNGPEKMGTSFGLTTLTIGFAVMIGPAMCGAIKDSEGTWDTAYVTTGVIAFVASAAAFMEYSIERRNASKIHK